MKLFSLAALALSAAIPGFAAATPVLNFETVGSFASINQYYNGGADGVGNIGPALGVTFGGDALALQNDALGPYFSHAPTPLGVMVAVGNDSALDVALGFTTGLSFYYSSSSALTNAVQVWSGLDGNGSLLASFNLALNAQAGSCSDSPYCHFDKVYAPFSGIARSVTFGNAANIVAFDNIELNAVPEPASMLLISLGLAGLIITRRRT